MDLRQLEIIRAIAETGSFTAAGQKLHVSQSAISRQVKLLVEDDVCKPEIAANTAGKLVSDKADVVLGHICSGAAKAALGIYRDAGVIAMSPSATNPELTQSGQYPLFYRTIAPDDAQARIEVDFERDRVTASLEEGLLR